MQVLSRCPLGVASILWLPRSGSYTLTVVCKATFRLEPDLSPLAEDQEPVIEGDTFRDHDEGKSLELATELVPFKRAPEVLLTGHAFAPRGQAVGTLLARLTVAEIDKAIEVTGDRHFMLDGSLSHPGRFSKMPLCWERAAGGPDTSNPVGVPMGDEARPDPWGRIAVPNLVPLGRMIAGRDDVVPPASFGPMAAHWPLRLARLHQHASGWSPHAWHARPLPSDFDAAYFNAAPPDQMLRELLGGERLTLENLHPQHPLLTTRLERVRPRAVVDWGSGPSNEIALACDTLAIDTDRCLATLTFRGHVTLDYPERAGWVIVTTDDLASAPAPALSAAQVAASTRAVPVPAQVGASTRAAPVPPQMGAPMRATGPAPVPPPAPMPALSTGSARGWEPAAPESPAVPAWRGLGKTAPMVEPGAEAPAEVASWPGRASTLPITSPIASPAVPRWMSDVRDVNETVAHDGDDASYAALPFVPEHASELDFVLPDDLDDEETFTSQKVDARGGAPLVPPVVPKGPRLGAFRLSGSSEPPPVGAGDVRSSSRRAELLEDAPTMDPDDAVLEEIGDDPSTVRPMMPGLPVPASSLGAAPPPPIVGAPPAPVAGAPPAWAPPSAAAVGDKPSRPTTWSGSSRTSASVMPFAPGPGDTGAHAPRAPVGGDDIGPGLPFVAKGSSRSSMSSTGAHPSGLPFASGAAAPVPPPPPPPSFSASGSVPAAPSSFGASGSVPAAPSSFGASGSVPAAPASRSSAAQMTIGERAAQTRGFGVEAAAVFVPEPTLDVGVSDSPPAPPPRLGPLATPAMVTQDLASASVASIVSIVSVAAVATGTSSDSIATSSSIATSAMGSSGASGGSSAMGSSGASSGSGATGGSTASGVSSGSSATGSSTASNTAGGASASGDSSVTNATGGSGAAGERGEGEGDVAVGALPLDEYPVERCARIAASVARTRERTAEILDAQKLDAERWEALKNHWAGEIKKETERGKTALLRAYDVAYVAQLEDERGPIAVEEYARIVVGSERGTVSATLAELHLPEGSMLRIHRVWMAKTGKDPELRRLVRSAVDLASTS